MSESTSRRFNVLRERWVQIAIVAALGVLLLGRWLAVGTADRLWAEALGVAETHASIARLRLLLFVAAFVGAAVWCLGNLFLVYRSIGSVHVPRRLGNIEILETVPRQYLWIGFMTLGVVLALALSLDARGWWSTRALAAAGGVVGVSDPILQRDASYYLFSLPWRRTIHGYVTVLTGVMLGVSLVLYAAVGAVRGAKRRIEVSDVARRHIGALLAVFAVALVWGYRLEPPEYLAGIHNVPFDSVLIDVRLPTARLLSAVGLLTCAASLLWIRYGRVALVLVGWGALAVLSFVGHYLVPAVAAGVRTDDQLRSPALDEARPGFVSEAYGIPDTGEYGVEPPPPRLDRGQVAVDANELEAPVVWDEFAVTMLLNQLARSEPYLEFRSATLRGYPTAAGRAVPIIVGVREVDLVSAGAVDPAFSWERVHLAPYPSARGAVAVRADLVSDDGRPMFIPNLRKPDSVVTAVTDVRLDEAPLLFGGSMSEFAVVSDGPARGVTLGGVLRRMALAWKLQSWQLVTFPAVSESSTVLWHRSARERLEQVAPFAAFGEPRALVLDGRVFWTAFGYVAARSFPLSPRTEWRGQTVGYLRAGFVGIVDAVTGATSVHLVPRPDPLSAAWAELAPDVVSPWGRLPSRLQAQLRYPDELFRIQMQLLRDPDTPQRPGFFGRLRPSANTDGAGRSPFWWFTPTPDDATPRIRRMATLLGGEPTRLAGLVEGAVTERGPVMRVTRFRRPWELSDPIQVEGRMVAERGVDLGISGPLKTVRVGEGVLSLQSTYQDQTDDSLAPTLLSVTVDWAGVVGEGSSFAEALDAALHSDRAARIVSADWAAARRWFEQLDDARRTGDWIAFGRAYEALRRLLVGEEDTVRPP